MKIKIKRANNAIKEQRAAYLFLIPALLGLTFITYLPLLAVFGISFMDWHAMVLNPNQSTMQKALLDKHYLRKHGKNAYYGQKSGGLLPENDEFKNCISQ